MAPLRPAPDGDEIARILRYATPAADAPIMWTQATSAVRAALDTNNATASRWVREATLAEKPAVVWVYITEGGVLERIVRPNTPAFSWYDPTLNREILVLVGPEAYGLPEYSDQLRFGPAGELWVSDRQPPVKGLAGATGMNRISCVVLATTLETLAQRNATMRAEWALGDTAAGAAVASVRALLAVAGIDESHPGQKLLLTTPLDDEGGSQPVELRLRLCGNDIHRLRQALRELGLRSP